MSKISGRINLYRVIRQIRQQPGISRLDIAGKLRLDKSTISRLVGNLTRSGLVSETPKDAPVGVSGGRKILELTLNAGFGCVIGIEVQSERVVAVLVDLLGNVLHST